MKTPALLSLVATLALLAAPPLFSQNRVALSPREQLQALQSANKKLLDQQAATLQKLEEMSKEASQLRIFVRRN